MKKTLVITIILTILFSCKGTDDYNYISKEVENKTDAKIRIKWLEGRFEPSNPRTTSWVDIEVGEVRAVIDKGFTGLGTFVPDTSYLEYKNEVYIDTTPSKIEHKYNIIYTDFKKIKEEPYKRRKHSIFRLVIDQEFMNKYIEEHTKKEE